jgi:hypothetical protein
MWLWFYLNSKRALALAPRGSPLFTSFLRKCVLHKRPQGIAKSPSPRAVLAFDLHPELNTKNVFGPPSRAQVAPPSTGTIWGSTKLSPIHQNQNSTLIGYDNGSRAHFSVSNTEFEGGGDGHGAWFTVYSDRICFAK